MVTTVAKEGPAPFSDAFVEIDSSAMRDLVRSWEEEGYTQFLNAKFPRIAVGTLMAEARILSVGLFFKGYNSSFENLKAGTFTGATKVLVLWKHYANMSSVGKSVSHAELEPAQVGEWLTFFECQGGMVFPINEFFYS